MQTGLNGTPTFDDMTLSLGADLPPARGRLVMVSNRGPVEHYYDDAGRLQRRCCSGGVATALASLATGTPLTWIATAGSQADRALASLGHTVELEAGKHLRLVSPAMEAYDLSYGTFCNPILWFLQHSLWDKLQCPTDEDAVLHAWERGYLPVNQTFAEAVVEELDEGGGPERVMLHDYHLYAAPLFIRNLRPAAVLQHFIHVPWPDPEAWKQLPRPVVESICEGLLANDSVVFQTEHFAHNFVRTCLAFLPDARMLGDGGSIAHAGRRTRVWSNPISVDVWELRSQLASPEVEQYRANLRGEAGELTIVRVDRLDPSKNVALGFRAFARLLEKHPEWIGRVRFLAFLVPSRTSVPEYCAYAEEVFAEIEAVNARYGRPGWTPVKVFHEHNRTQALVGLSLYDVLLVNPVVDGMNLISKEGPVVNGRDGVLVLSDTAGSFAELKGTALAVHPHDVEGTAEALHAALSLPAAERRERAQRLREAVLRYGLARWLRLLVEDLGRQEATAPVRASAAAEGGEATAGASRASA